MSALSLQADKLRKCAERLRQLANVAVKQGFPARQDLYESAAEMREAADTIEGLRDRLQEANARQYDIGYENGVKHTLAELDAVLASASGTDDVAAWAEGERRDML